MITEHTITRNNNFDVLRLVAAILVLFSHSYPLSGYPEPRLPFYASSDGSYGWLGVRLFFLISGFLITMSWFRHENLKQYLKARVVRIFPALLVVVGVTVFVVGPLVTTLTSKQYFSHPSTFAYFNTLLLYTRNLPLPGVFDTNNVPVVNGSLWTLQYEWTLYMLIGILGVTGLLRRSFVILTLFIGVLSLYTFNKGMGLTIGTLNGLRLLDLSCYFLAGSVFYRYKDRIPLRPLVALFCGALLVLSVFIGGVPNLLIVPLLTYLVFYFALHPSLDVIHRTLRLDKLGDFSYGLYIYAFLVQEFIVFSYGGGVMPPLLNFLLALPVTLLCAVASWYGIERRALALKNRL